MTLDFSAFMGQSSSPVRNEVEKGAIRRFAEALGDPNPLYRDEVYARSMGYASVPAPPTFSRTFDYGTIAGFTLPEEGLIHGDQSFTYYAPIVAGDVLYCSSQLLQVKERKGSLGKMVFLVLEQSVRDGQGQLRLQEQMTVIYTEPTTTTVS
ncbi:MaoC family dehydratase [Alicyclobacillaceae bacterium I2511]|nr:MaoC family dehydratase [Alicyclobacillaceae bacterium I2511]